MVEASGHTEEPDPEFSGRVLQHERIRRALAAGHGDRRGPRPGLIRRERQLDLLPSILQRIVDQHDAAVVEAGRVTGRGNGGDGRGLRR